MTTHATSDAMSGPGLDTWLEPVRRSLLDDATAEADRIVAEARTVASARIAEAEENVDEELRRAEQRGRAVAEARTAAEVAREAERARREVLATARRIHERLIAETRAASTVLRGDPRYPSLLNRLEELARAQLGDELTIRHDDDLGGLIASDDRGRRVDYRLPELAERALGDLAEEIARLWE